MQKLKTFLSKSHVKHSLPIIWFFASIMATLYTMFVLAVSFSSSNLRFVNYLGRTASNVVLGASSTSQEIEYKNIKVDAIERVFTKYNCPMKGTGYTFVEEAEKHNIPFWLVASVAFQESTCGKNTPRKDGQETYNAYGWGVWGSNVKQFDSWEHGISVVSKYFSEQFYQEGVTELCDIMSIYTPPSNGSWCRGVGYFRDEILQYPGIENTLKPIDL